MDESAIDQIVDWLGEAVADGPRAPSSLLEALLAEGMAPAMEEAEASVAETILGEIADQSLDLGLDPLSGLIFDQAQVAVGRCFTHRLTAKELDAGLIESTPDLEPLVTSLIRIREVELYGPGFEAGVEIGAGLHSWGLPGPLAELEPDTLVAFTLRPGRRVEVAWPVVPGDGEAEREAVMRLINDRFLDQADGIGFELYPAPGFGLSVVGSEFTEPQPPMVEIMADLGYSFRAGFFGPADEEWETPLEEKRGENLIELVRKHEVSRGAAIALAQIASDWWATIDGMEPALSAEEIRGLLAHDELVWPVDELMSPISLVRDMRNRFLGPVAEGRRPGAGAAKCLLAIGIGFGDPLDSERLLKQAERDAPGIPAIKVALGMLNLDRGDGRRARYYFSQLGLEADHPLMEAVSGREPALPKVGRNDPCPCGSGKKSKRCHNGESTLGASVRLVDRLVIYLARARPFGLQNLQQEYPDLDGFGDEIYLFEGGGIREYLTDRGDLLSDDDRSELESWASARRRLFEVTSVTPGAGLGLMDLASGERLVVAEDSGSQEATLGDLLLAVVAEAEAPFLAGNGVTVPEVHRERTLALVREGASAYDWASWWEGLDAPPELRNREGHEFEPMEVGIDVPLPVAELKQWLNRVGEPAGEFWHHLISLDGERVVDAVFSIDEDEPYTDDPDSSFLIVEVNSPDRADRMIDLVEAAFEGAVAVSVDYLDLDLDADRLAGLPAGGTRPGDLDTEGFEPI